MSSCDKNADTCGILDSVYPPNISGMYSRRYVLLRGIVEVPIASTEISLKSCVQTVKTFGYIRWLLAERIFR